MALRPSQRIQFNISLRHFKRRHFPKKVPQFCNLTYKKLPDVEVMEDERELDEFYARWDKLPLTKANFDEAWKALGVRVKHKLTQEGFLEKNFI